MQQHASSELHAGFFTRALACLHHQSLARRLHQRHLAVHCWRQSTSQGSTPLARKFGGGGGQQAKQRMVSIKHSKQI